MKKFAIGMIAAAALSLGVNQQASAQVEQGNILIDPYVGGPTGNVWWGALSNELDFKTLGAPISFGGRFEYMVADNFGVGVDVNYVTTGYEYTYEDWNYNSTTGQYEDATYAYTAKKLRAMLRLNYHIVQTSEFDAYLGVGAGYKSAKRQYTIDGEVDGSIGYDALIPVAFRLAFGGRYYFTDFLGINFEIGAGGGGIIQGGLALKF